MPMRYVYLALSLLICSQLVAQPNQKESQLAVVKKNIASVDKAALAKLLNDKEKLSTLKTELSESQEDLLEIAEKVRDTYDLKKDYKGKRWEYLLVGGVMILAGGVDATVKLFSNSSDASKSGKDAGLLTNDMVYDLGLVGYGGRLVYMGWSGKDPARKFTDAVEIVKLLNKNLDVVKKIQEDKKEEDENKINSPKLKKKKKKKIEKKKKEDLDSDSENEENK